MLQNYSTDTSVFTGAGVSYRCADCRDMKVTNMSASSGDIVDGKLRIDKTGCGPKDSGNSSGLSPLALGLIIGFSVFAFLFYYFIFMIWCCCCKSVDGPAAGQRSRPKSRKHADGANMNTSQYYKEKYGAGLELPEQELNRKKSLELDDSQSGYVVSEPKIPPQQIHMEHLNDRKR